MDDTSKQFFQELYQDCSQGRIEIRPIPLLPRKLFVKFGDIDELDALCKQYSSKNLYFGVATRDGGAKKEHIVEIPALWADFDFKDFKSDDPEGEIRKYLSAYPLEPSAIIHSGGGLHVYWFLSEPAAKSEIPRIEALLKTIQVHLKSDPMATDASRILRIPGTRNRKPERENAICKVSELHPDRRYALEDFETVNSEEYLPQIREETEKAVELIEKEEKPILWPKIREEAFYGIIGEFSKLSCKGTEVDPIAVLMTLIAAAGNEIGADKYIKVLEDRHPARVFTLLAGATARGGKGTSFGIVRALLNCIQELPFDLNNYQTARNTSLSLSSGEGVVYQVRDQVYKMKLPTQREIEIAEKKGAEKPQPKKEIIDEGVKDKRLLIINNEFKGAFQAMNRKENTLNSTMIKLWDALDSDEVGNMIKNEQSTVTGPHVSIIGHIQTSVLKRHVEQNYDCTETGFLNRFLIVCVRRQGYVSNPKPIDTELKNKYAKLFLEALLTAKRTTGAISQTQAAIEYFDSIYRELNQSYGERLDEILARGAAYIKRLALIFCLMDRESKIDRRHMEAGKAIWDYCVESARFVFGDKEHTEEKTLLKALAEKPLSQSEIYSLFPNAGKDKIKAIIQRCVAKNCIEHYKEPTAGRPKTVYRLIPN